MALRNQPYLPLYVQDFLTDEKLMECSAEATGVYIRIMCVMHKSNEYGTVLLKLKDKQNDEQITNFAYKLAKFMPYPVVVIIKALIELLDESVLEINGDILQQNRMIADNKLSVIRAKAGSKGGKISQSLAQAKHEASIQASTETVNENVIKDVIKDVSNKVINVSFDEFWNLYDYKNNKEECEKLWIGEKKTKHGLIFNDEARQKIMDYLPMFVERTYKNKYPSRPYPHSFLFQHQWLDEIPEKQVSSSLGSRRTPAPKRGEDVYADL